MEKNLMATTSRTYEDILNAARQLTPEDQRRLVKELLSEEYYTQMWDQLRETIHTKGPIASESEIDEAVSEVRAERRRVRS
jgi:hypothetical protein